jgi:hypothetical protein
MKRIALNAIAVLIICIGGFALARPVDAAAGCCYNDCMTHCQREYSFMACHNFCNSECQACIVPVG